MSCQKTDRSMMQQRLVLAAAAQLAVFLGLCIACLAFCAASVLVPACCALVHAAAPPFFVFFLNGTSAWPDAWLNQARRMRTDLRQMQRVGNIQCSYVLNASPFSGILPAIEFETD